MDPKIIAEAAKTSPNAAFLIAVLILALSIVELIKFLVGKFIKQDVSHTDSSSLLAESSSLLIELRDNSHKSLIILEAVSGKLDTTLECSKRVEGSLDLLSARKEVEELLKAEHLVAKQLEILEKINGAIGGNNTAARTRR